MSFLVTVGIQLPPKLGSSFLHPPKLKMSDRQTKKNEKFLTLKFDLKEDKCSGSTDCIQGHLNIIKCL